MATDWAYVKVTNKAGYVGSFSVGCQFNGVALKYDWGDGFPAPQSKTTRIPAGATQIAIHFDYYVTIGDRKHIKTASWPDTSQWKDATVSYELEGVTVDPKVKHTS